MGERIIKEGGYQPTKDPPDRPPEDVIKPAQDDPSGSGSEGGSSDAGDGGEE